MFQKQTWPAPEFSTAAQDLTAHTTNQQTGFEDAVRSRRWISKWSVTLQGSSPLLATCLVCQTQLTRPLPVRILEHAQFHLNFSFPINKRQVPWNYLNNFTSATTDNRKGQESAGNQVSATHWQVIFNWLKMWREIFRSSNKVGKHLLSMNRVVAR